jgi:outer membrane protein assembly factor BamE (lipoprotein component of BamABCDE complex)
MHQQGSILKMISEENIKIGVDTKDSIMKRCGPPNIISALPDANGAIRWYYVQRIVSESPVRGQHGIMNASVMITFDPRGTVVDKQYIVGESKVPISSRKTKEPGYKTSFLHEAFANIGRFGQTKVDKGA